MTFLVSSSMFLLLIYLTCCSDNISFVDSTSMICYAFLCMRVIHDLVLLIYSLIKLWCKLVQRVVCTFVSCLHIFLSGIKLMTNCMLLPTICTLFLFRSHDRIKMLLCEHSGDQNHLALIGNCSIYIRKLFWPLEIGRAHV